MVLNVNVIKFANDEMINTLIPQIYKKKEKYFTVKYWINNGFVKDLMSLHYEEEVAKFNFDVT